MHTGNGLWKQQNKQVCTLDCTTETVKKRGIFVRCFFYILSEQIGEMCGMCVGVCTATQWRNTVCVCVCVCTWLVTSDTTEKYAVCVHVCVCCPQSITEPLFSYWSCFISGNSYTQHNWALTPPYINTATHTENKLNEIQTQEYKTLKNWQILWQSSCVIFKILMQQMWCNIRTSFRNFRRDAIHHLHEISESPIQRLQMTLIIFSSISQHARISEWNV